MKLLKTYDDKEEAEDAATRIYGKKRLASERDSTTVIYNLFGSPNWGNFHRLGMYDLDELRTLLACRDRWELEKLHRHEQIISSLKKVAKTFDLTIPSHWI